MATFENSTTNTTDSTRLKNIKELIKTGVDRNLAIKTILSIEGNSSEDLISKYEVMLDSESDLSIESQRPTMKKYDIPNQMIFKAGKWKGRITTIEDLQDAVKCYQDTKDNFKPIQKFTHKEKDEHAKDPILNTLPFRLGDLENIRLVGDELYADRKNIPEPIYNMIQDGLITSHSAEFKENVTINGQKYKRFLYADAFLGSQLPALAPVMKPFFYDSDNNETDLVYDCEISVNYDEEPINYIYDNEENEEMNKATYEAKMKKWNDSGIKGVKTYEEYSAMDSDGQSSYVGLMDSKVTKEKGMYSDEVPQITQVNNVDLENAALKEELRKMKEKATYDAEEAAKSKYDAELNQLKQANAAIQLKLANEELQREKEANEKYVFSFTKNSNGPIFPISMEKDFIDMLNNMDKPESDKVTYSDGTATKEGSIKDNVKTVFTKLGREMMALMPKGKSNKFAYSTNEYAQSSKGGNVNKFNYEAQDFIGDKSNYADDETLALVDDDAEIMKYAAEKGISYEESFDIFYKTSSEGAKVEIIE